MAEWYESTESMLRQNPKDIVFPWMIHERFKMTEYQGIVATTHEIQRGGQKTAFTKGELEAAAKKIDGERGLPFTVEHDPFCLPIGKTTRAWVEPYESEYALMAVTYVEDSPTYRTHPNTGTRLAHLSFRDAPKPFVKKFEGFKDNQVSVSVDVSNFDTWQDFRKFERDVKNIDENFSCRREERHELIPEPIIQFVISNPALSGALGFGIWASARAEKFVRNTVDETLKSFSIDLAEILHVKLKEVFRVFGNRRSTDDRPVLVQFVMKTGVDLVLLARVEDDEDIPVIDLEKLTAEIENYKDLLHGAEEVTFALSGTDDWEFQYLKTKTGEVLGTAECYERTREKSRNISGVSIHISRMGD